MTKKVLKFTAKKDKLVEKDEMCRPQKLLIVVWPLLIEKVRFKYLFCLLFCCSAVWVHHLTSPHLTAGYSPSSSNCSFSFAGQLAALKTAVQSSQKQLVQCFGKKRTLDEAYDEEWRSASSLRKKTLFFLSISLSFSVSDRLCCWMKMAPKDKDKHADERKRKGKHGEKVRKSKRRKTKKNGQWRVCTRQKWVHQCRALLAGSNDWKVRGKKWCTSTQKPNLCLAHSERTQWTSKCILPFFCFC